MLSPPLNVSSCCDWPVSYGDFGAQPELRPSLFQTAIKQSGQSEALTRASADLSLSRSFLDPQDQSSKGPHTDALRKKYISQTFVRLTDMPTCPMTRLNRYEHLLWRQARQIVMTLKSLRVSSRGQCPKRPQFMSGHHRRGE